MLQYSYAYDDLGQLTRENNLPAGRTYLYTYDKDGNILSKTECNYTTSNTPSVIGVTSFTYGNGRSDVLKKITLPNGQTFTPTHDIVGNPSSVMIENGNTMAAMWSYGRRLTMVVAGPDMFTYDYNADGIRTTKTVNGVKHTYALSGTTILNEEWTENGVQHLLMYVYDANGSPTGMVYRNSTMSMGVFEEYLFVKNIQGDILHVYNSAGKKLVSYVYDAWGNIISTTYSNGGATTAARFNPFTYRGYYRDSETGMYYLNSRYYNPKMGRFISADAYVSTGQGLLGYNMYVYCLNNPVNYVDPSGTCAHQVIGDCNHCLMLILSGDEIPEQQTNNYGSEGDVFDYDVIESPFYLYGEHHKRGSTNPKNRNKHEEGQSRKDRDHGGEKGDARRKPNPNKRRIQYDVSEKVVDGIASGVIIIGASVAVGYVLLNDITGVGVADDGAIGVLIPVIANRVARIVALF